MLSLSTREAASEAWLEPVQARLPRVPDACRQGRSRPAGSC